MAIYQVGHSVGYLPTPIPKVDTIPYIQFQVLAEHQPYLSRADRNGNQEVGRLFVRLLGAQLGGSEGVASIQLFELASSILHFYDNRRYVIINFHAIYKFI